MSGRSWAVLAAVSLYLLCTYVAIVRRRERRLRAALGWALTGWGSLGLLWLT